MKPLLRYRGVTPWFYGLQRRWDSINSPLYVDATIGFDLRTAVEARRKKQPKPQERWLEAGYGSFVSKKGSNYEIGSASTLNTTGAQNCVTPMQLI